MRWDVENKIKIIVFFNNIPFIYFIIPPRYFQQHAGDFVDPESQAIYAPLPHAAALISRPVHAYLVFIARWEQHMTPFFARRVSSKLYLFTHTSRASALSTRKTYTNNTSIDSSTSVSIENSQMKRHSNPRNYIIYYATTMIELATSRYDDNNIILPAVLQALTIIIIIVLVSCSMNYVILRVYILFDDDNYYYW